MLTVGVNEHCQRRKLAVKLLKELKDLFGTGFGTEKKLLKLLFHFHNLILPVWDHSWVFQQLLALALVPPAPPFRVSTVPYKMYMVQNHLFTASYVAYI